jgi:predicted Fe-S protein YdhL (DUF1289 family)
MSEDHTHYWTFPAPSVGSTTLVGVCHGCGATSERAAHLSDMTAKERHSALGQLTTEAKSVARMPFPIGREQGGVR